MTNQTIHPDSNRKENAGERRMLCRGFRSVLLAAGVLLLLSGCGSSSSQVQNSKSAEYSYSAAESDYGVFGETGAAGGAGSYDYASDVSYEEAYPEEAAEEGITEEDVILEDGKDHEDSPESKRKLITTVNISVQTKEFDVLQKSIETSVEELGGYIESSEIYYNSYSYYRSSDPSNYTPHDRSASYVLRIPEKRLDEFLTKLHDGSNVTEESKSVTDITLDYVDTAAHKKALQTEARSLEKMLEKAKELDDIVKIQSRLTEVRYQINSIESQLRTYDNKVDYSTVRLDVSEVTIYQQAPGATAWEKISTGFRNSLHSVGTGFADFGIWFIIHIPQLIVAAVIILLAVLVIRKALKNRRTKVKSRKTEKRKYESRFRRATDPKPDTETVEKAEEVETNPKEIKSEDASTEIEPETAPKPEETPKPDETSKA